MKPKLLPPIEDIRLLLDYDMDTGKLSWRERSSLSLPSTAPPKFAGSIATFNRLYAGQEAFTRKTANGYFAGVFMDRPYLAHRIAFSHYHGWHPDYIDHINGDKLDNRITNLRSVSKRDNATNRKVSVRNTSGVTGVCRRGKKWGAIMRIDGKFTWLGTFETVEEAAACRAKACAEYGYIDRYD